MNKVKPILKKDENFKYTVKDFITQLAHILSYTAIMW